MSYEYDNYLNEHIGNVKKGFEWLRAHLPDVISDDYDYSNIYDHDGSKLDPEEYDAYDKYFYGNNKSYQVKQGFNYAWLHHIHHNLHHWQYWVLINGDPDEGMLALEMPYEYIIEMICDWWSFSWKSGNLTEIFDWYEEHKNRMILESDTRSIVEYILQRMRQILIPGEEIWNE